MVTLCLKAYFWVDFPKIILSGIIVMLTQILGNAKAKLKAKLKINELTSHNTLDCYGYNLE